MAEGTAGAREERPGTPALCVYTRAWTSGAGLFAQELVGGLLARGARVTFISPRVDRPALGHDPRLRWLHPPRERPDGASAPIRALWSLARIAGGALALARARCATRLFIVTIPDPLPAAIAMLLLLRLSGARILFVAHDPVPHVWRLGPRWRRFEVGAHGVCYRLASAIVVLSEPSREKLREVYPTLRCPVEVIEHGVFVMGGPTPPPGSGRLLAFGTIRRNKGMLEAMAGTIAARAGGVPVRLLVAGGPHWDDPGYADECAALARTAPDAIELRLGFVDDAELPRLLAESDALLMPYAAFFSQSGVVLLAASNARPVIATAAGGIGPLIAEGMPAVTIAEPASATQVAHAIATFYATPLAEWRERALAYRAVTLERRSWPAIAGRYLALGARR